MTKSKWKNILYTFALIIAMGFVWWLRESRDNLKEWDKVELTGATMGTSYQVKYLVSESISYQTSIDSLLEDINLCLSTYIPESEISRFNKSTLHKFERPYFYEMLIKSRSIYQKTIGAFDPTVMPLVVAWGFGPVESELPNQDEVDYLLTKVGFEKIFFDEYAVCKLESKVQLDFSAIAKGYAVDLVVDFLMEKDLENIFVEIGGEIAAKGVNERGKPWAIFIEKPEDHQQSVQAMVSLDNVAIATSGNYRNFHIKDGKKYTHTISPFTGHPVQHNLLSASVFAGDCATADAYATAFMVLGLKKALEIVTAQEELEAYFIYSDDDGQFLTKATSGIKDQILE
jgi:thiamine biosynthesis lipoprotein